MALSELLRWFRGCYGVSYFGSCSHCGNFIVDQKCFLVPALDGKRSSSYYHCCSLNCAIRKAESVGKGWVADVLRSFWESENTSRSQA